MNIHYYCRCFACKLAGEKSEDAESQLKKNQRRENGPSIQLENSCNIWKKRIFSVDRKQFFWQFISCVFHRSVELIQFFLMIALDFKWNLLHRQAINVRHFLQMNKRFVTDEKMAK